MAMASFLSSNPSTLSQTRVDAATSAMTRKRRGLRGDRIFETYRTYANATSILANTTIDQSNVIISKAVENEDFCQRRKVKQALGHDEEWYNVCHMHLVEADTVNPKGKWTMSEFRAFCELQMQSPFHEFGQIPLPLVMTFHELACRCRHYNPHDTNCCIGANAQISAPPNSEDEMSWTRTICNRVDTALEEVCARDRSFRTEL